MDSCHVYQCFLSPLLCIFQIHCDSSEEKQFILAFDDDNDDDDDDDDDVELNVLGCQVDIIIRDKL